MVLKLSGSKLIKLNPLFSDPVRLSLSSSFGSLMFQLVNQTTGEKEAGVYGALPKVCLVVSQSHRISEMDFQSAQRILLGSMKQFPDLYFVFLSNDVNTFKEMATDRRLGANGKMVRKIKRGKKLGKKKIVLKTKRNEKNFKVNKLMS